jgi:hypothetical protein
MPTKTKTKPESKAAPETAAPPVLAFKGFDAKFACRGHQFEVGKTYTTTGNIAVCEHGFHACDNPLDVWGYYSPGNSRFALVELSGKTERHSGDSKIAAASITIKAELKLPDFIAEAVDYLLWQVDFKNASATTTGEWSAATNTGNQSAATNTGDRSAATNTGEWSAATNTGDRSAATNTGEWSAATNTGNQSAATNTGDRSAAVVEGNHSVAIATGIEGRATAGETGAICLVCRDEISGAIIAIRASKVGENGINAGVVYRLNAAGEFEEIVA